MNDALRQALTPNRSAVKTALADAERRLVELRAEEAELEQLITRARKELGIEAHECRVFRSDASRCMRRWRTSSGNTWRGHACPRLAAAVMDSGLYRKKDGSTLEPNQIHARVNRYGDLFAKNGSLITLKQT